MLADTYDYVTSTVDSDSDEACKEQRPVKVTQGHGNQDNVRATRRRQRANVRERSRMRSINAAFDRLRSLLPPPPGYQIVTTADGRPARQERSGPSKVETLRLAVAYIGCLTRLVQNSPPLSPQADLDSDALTSIAVVQSPHLTSTHHCRESCHPRK